MDRRAFAALLGAVLLASGCTYAWPMGPPGGDAGGDAPFIADAGGDRGAAEGGEDSGGDVGPPDSPVDAGDCRALGSDLEANRTKAKVCESAAGACSADVIDECACKVWVGNGANSATFDFQASVTAYLNAGCHPVCAPKCASDGTTFGNCVIAAGGGLACVP